MQGSILTAEGVALCSCCPGSPKIRSWLYVYLETEAHTICCVAGRGWNIFILLWCITCNMGGTAVSQSWRCWDSRGQSLLLLHTLTWEHRERSVPQRTLLIWGCLNNTWRGVYQEALSGHPTWAFINSAPIQVSLYYNNSLYPLVSSFQIIFSCDFFNSQYFNYNLTRGFNFSPISY